MNHHSIRRSHPPLLLLLVATVITTFFSANAVAQRAPATALPERGVSKVDRNFAHEAGTGLSRDMALALLAQQRAQNGAVRSFATRVYDRRQQALAGLKRIAQQTGVRMPVAMDMHHRKDIAQLRKLSGRDFDLRFLDLIAGADYVRFFEYELTRNVMPVDPKVARYAKTELQRLRQDQQQARKLLQGYPR